MSKKTFLLCYTDGHFEKTKGLTEEHYELLDSGHLKIVDVKAWKFLTEDGEWDEILEAREAEEEEEEEIVLDDEDSFDPFA